MIESSLLGILASIIAALFFGLYPAPRRYVRSGIIDFMISMSLGVIITSVALSVSFRISVLVLNFYQIGLSLLAGGLWGIAIILYVYSVDCVGVGRATPVKNITAVFGVIFGLVFFQEYVGLSLWQFVYLGVGTFLVVYAAKILGSVRGKLGVARPTCPVNLVTPDFLHEDKKENIITGGILAFGAAVFFGINTIPLKLLSISVNNTPEFFPIAVIRGLGALMTAIIADFVLTSEHTWKESSLKEHLFAGLSGLLWTGGFLGLILGIRLIGLSISWPLAMSSTVFAVLYGLFIGKEVDFASQKKEVLGGIFLGVLGIILLSLSI